LSAFHFSKISPHRLGANLWVAAILGALTGCAGDAPPSTEGERPALDPGPAVDPPAEVAPSVVPLRPVDSGTRAGSGEVVLWRSDDVLVVLLEVSGVEEEELYPAHIHIGSCAEGGPVAVVLNPLLGLDDGTGSSVTSLEPDELKEGDPHFVLLQTEGGVPLACGDLEVS
jgi:hypothetical protein